MANLTIKNSLPEGIKKVNNVWKVDSKMKDHFVKEYVIPYGNCILNSDGYLKRIDEKPKYDFLFNTGLYVLNPDILDLIPENKFYHITHLIEDAKNQGKKVGVFPIEEDDWIDIGQWSEYKKALNIL